MDIKAALINVGVTATLTEPHPPQIDIDGTGLIQYGPSSTPGMLAIECSLGTAGTNGTPGWELDVFLIAVKNGQARSHSYAARYQEKDLLTMPGAFNPGDTLLAPSTGGAAIYHLRIADGDAILEASSGAHGEQYNVYDAKLASVTKTLGDQFQKAADAS